MKKKGGVGVGEEREREIGVGMVCVGCGVGLNFEGVWVRVGVDGVGVFFLLHLMITNESNKSILYDQRLKG